MALPRDQYFIVVQVSALAVTACLMRMEPRVLTLVLLALASVMAAQVVFWLFIYPANVAAANWTVPLDNREKLHRQWEYSHGAGAILPDGAR